MGMVVVLPGMLPASISVAPNSPMDLEKDKTVAAAIPGHARGTVIVQNILLSETPRVLAAFIMLLSICSKAPLVVLYMIGKDTAAAAMTVADQENTICIPMEYRNAPMGLFLPNIISNIRPRTVGGSTKGKVKTASKIDEILLDLLYKNLAAQIPKKNVITVEHKAVFIDIQSGE